MMKRILMILLLVVACQQVEPLIEPEPAVGPEFSAQIEAFGSDTKTALAYGNSVVWSTDDQVAIFQGESVADKYQVKSDRVGTTSGVFEIVANGSGTSTETFQTNVALYPYQDGLICSSIVEDEVLTSYQITGVTIPSTQTYVPGSFPDDAFLMAAMTDDIDDHALSFKNLCGALKLQLKGTMKVKKIMVQGHESEKLSGNATVTLYADGSMPYLEMSENSGVTATLDCGDGVQLSEDTSAEFIMSIAPTQFAKGFTVSIVGAESTVARIVTSKQNSVGRSYHYGNINKIT